MVATWKDQRGSRSHPATRPCAAERRKASVIVPHRRHQRRFPTASIAVGSCDYRDLGVGEVELELGCWRVRIGLPHPRLTQRGVLAEHGLQRATEQEGTLGPAGLVAPVVGGGRAAQHQYARCCHGRVLPLRTMDQDAV